MTVCKIIRTKYLGNLNVCTTFHSSPFNKLLIDFSLDQSCEQTEKLPEMKKKKEKENRQNLISNCVVVDWLTSNNYCQRLIYKLKIAFCYWTLLSYILVSFFIITSFDFLVCVKHFVNSFKQERYKRNHHQIIISARLAFERWSPSDD